MGDFSEYFFKDLNLDFSDNCGRKYILTKKERAITELVLWMRNLNQGLKFSMKNHFHIGPFGIRDKKGWWWPCPSEGCDACIKHVVIIPIAGVKSKWNPWALWKHSKSLQHIEYLLKNRPDYLLESTFKGLNVYAIQMMLKNIEEDTIYNLRAIANESSNWYINKFFDDVTSGKFIRPYENKIIRPNTRFDLLKST
jgi:hypothetical protein